MKIKLFSLVVIVSIAISLFPEKNVGATFCYPSPPKIGVVNEISTSDSESIDSEEAIIFLDRVYTFDGSEEYSDGSLNINKYQDIVHEYIARDFKLYQKLSSKNDNINFISINKNALEKLQINNGDIIIKVPLFPCSQKGFNGFFAKDGRLKKVFLSVDDFANLNLSINDSRLEIQRRIVQDEEAESAYVNEYHFQFDDESFILLPGEMHEFADGDVQSIFFLKTTKSSGPMGEGYTGTEYIIDFEGNVDFEENVNFFQRIWNWLVSLFR